MGRVFSSLADQDFNRLFSEFRYTAYRLETLQRYDVFYEKNEFERFLAGESRGRFPGISDWINETVAKAVTAGKKIGRVHVVEEPLSDYVRFECAWAYTHTVTAGEDVRIIPVAHGEWPSELPHYDYWLFDSVHLVAMYYEPDGSFSTAETITDQSRVIKANYWRDLAINNSIPYRDFARHYDPQFLFKRGPLRAGRGR